MTRTARTTSLVTHGDADLSTVADARRAAREWLFGVHGADADLVDTVLVVVSELVTNAIRHGGTGWVLTLTAARDGGVLVRVGDSGPGIPAAVLAGDDDTSGRGLALVRALSSAWGWHPVPLLGKVVWCEVAAP